MMQEFIETVCDEFKIAFKKGSIISVYKRPGRVKVYLDFWSLKNASLPAWFPEDFYYFAEEEEQKLRLDTFTGYGYEKLLDIPSVADSYSDSDLDSLVEEVQRLADIYVLDKCNTLRPTDEYYRCYEYMKKVEQVMMEKNPEVHVNVEGGPVDCVITLETNYNRWVIWEGLDPKGIIGESYYEPWVEEIQLLLQG